MWPWAVLSTLEKQIAWRCRLSSLQRAQVSCIIEIWGTRAAATLSLVSLFSRALGTCQSLSRVSSSFGGADCCLLALNFPSLLPHSTPSGSWNAAQMTAIAHAAYTVQREQSANRRHSNEDKREKSRPTWKEWRSELECLSSTSHSCWVEVFFLFTVTEVDDFFPSDDDFPHNLCTTERRRRGWRWLSLHTMKI